MIDYAVFVKGYFLLTRYYHDVFICRLKTVLSIGAPVNQPAKYQASATVQAEYKF